MGRISGAIGTYAGWLILGVVLLFAAGAGATAYALAELGIEAPFKAMGAFINVLQDGGISDSLEEGGSAGGGGAPSSGAAPESTTVVPA